jgi:photosystem II stability/assembly factor-like uncharacterized protein
VGLLAAAGIATAFLSGGDGAGSATAPFVGGDLHSLVMDPIRPETAYVGGHAAVAVSIDGGESWHQVETLEGADAMGWAFTDDLVLAGGHPGLFVSEDGGRTFTHRNEGLPATDIHALGAGGGVIYAASPVVGVFASTDGGASWDVRTDQVGQSFMGRILVDPQDSQHVLAPDMANGVVESADGGRTWHVLGRFGGAMWVSWDPNDTDRIIASAMDAAALTLDGGDSWQPLVVPEGVSIVEMDPGSPQTLLAAALDGSSATIWISTDGGATWERS